MAKKIEDYKQDYEEARSKGDVEGMRAANDGANQLRNEAGESAQYANEDIAYIKGLSGYGSAGTVGKSGGKSSSYGSAPEYISKYQSQISSLADQLLNRDPFSYDHTSDPTYAQYKTAYTREGQRAMQDTMGEVSARTGGLASSYATTAASQANNYYMAQLADKIPELQQLAYSMYQNEGDTLRSNLSMLQGLDSSSYGRYQDQLGQYNTDRSFQYGLSRDAVADDRYQNEWNYGVGRDVLSDDRYADETDWNRDTYQSGTTYDQALNKAQTLAAYGDFSGYQALGYTDEEIQRMDGTYKQAQSGTTRTRSTTTSGGGGGGDDSGGDYENLFDAAEESSYPRSFIANNYKKFGFTSASGLYDEYTQWQEKPKDFGTSYSSIWSRARTMFDKGASTQEIMGFLDDFSKTQLTKYGLDYIMNSLDLDNFRTGPEGGKS